MQKPVANNISIVIVGQMEAAKALVNLVIDQLDPEALDVYGNTCLQDLAQSIRNTLDIARALNKHTRGRSTLVI